MTLAGWHTFFFLSLTINLIILLEDAARVRIYETKRDYLHNIFLLCTLRWIIKFLSGKEEERRVATWRKQNVTYNFAMSKQYLQRRWWMACGSQGNNYWVWLSWDGCVLRLLRNVMELWKGKIMWVGERWMGWYGERCVGERKYRMRREEEHMYRLLGKGKDTCRYDSKSLIFVNRDRMFVRSCTYLRNLTTNQDLVSDFF